MLTITFKGKPNPKDKNLVKIEMVLYKPGYNRTPKLISISGLYEDWDNQNQCFKTNIKKDPDRNKQNQARNKSLLDLKTKYFEAARLLDEEGVSWSPVECSHYYERTDLNGTKNERVKVMTVSQSMDIIIAEKQNEQRLKNGVFVSCSGTATLYRKTKDELERFTKKVYNRNFSSYFFREIGEKFLKDFVLYLQHRGVENGNNAAMPQKLKCLYGVFYYSNQKKQPHTDTKIFECIEANYKVVDTKPQTIPYDWIVKIEDMDKSKFTKKEQFHIDLFLFSFYCGGIAPIDICFLTWDSINNNMVVYERHKFPKKAEMPLNDNILDIIRKYADKCYNNYVLPILTHKQVEEWQKRDRVERLQENVSKTLKKVSQVLSFEKEFTWYAARGTFITKMINEGYHPIRVAKYSGNSPATIYKHYWDETNPDDARQHMNQLFSRKKVS